MMICFSVTGAAAPVFGQHNSDERVLSFYNIHTKENISVVFKRDGQYVPEALKKLDHFMRDWRRNVTTKMDPELYDLIWSLHRELGSRKPIRLICGHRTAATNKSLRRRRGGQARKSLHITGQAADIQFPDVPLKQLRYSALIMEHGGVGYYPRSSIPFVHIDTGRVRHWPRVPRRELAALFPNGRSKHVPRDGKRLTRKDFRVAVASLRKKGKSIPFALRRHLQNSNRTLLASLDQGATVPAVKPKRHLVLASLSPSFSSNRNALEKTPEEPAKSPPVELEQEDDIEYDDAEMAGILEYQPFPITPFLTEKRVASMDMTAAGKISLPSVHQVLSEKREMLVDHFRKLKKSEEFAAAERFQGTFVQNTSAQRLKRSGHRLAKVAQK
jgi:uncharacterized protein YcbK (DUF882 family)